MKEIYEDRVLDNTPGKEKHLHHNVFGPLNLNAPACKHKGCKRKAWLGPYCPDHKDE